jgi:hypothetical protein
LFCLTNDAFAGSGPPGGLCTMRCTTDGQCLELDDDLYCVQFTDTTRVCLEGCTTGSAGEPKCHQRDDFACSLLGVIPGSVVCDSSDDCQAGELCDATGVCGKIVTSCLPTCGGNFDCGPGQFCSFASGFCLNQQPGGLPLGSACTESDPDPCNGFCTEGECSALCTITTLPFGCGWNGQGVAEAACLFTTFLSPPGDAGIGDVGLCGKLCDCNAECPLAGEYCVDESEGLVLDVWGRNGYCRPLATGETEADSFSACP